MPHFTLQILPTGPMADAFIGVSQARRTTLQSLGQPVPQAQQVRVLIDTGASGTGVDPSVLSALGLSPTGTIPVFTPTTGANAVDCNTYDVGLLIPATAGQPPFVVQTMAVMEHELFNAQGFHALIGRDVLSRCIFYYNGSTNLFTLAY